MLDVQFKRNSAPIDDAELLSVMDAIRREPEPLNDLALLLAKMVLRIRQVEAQAPTLPKIGARHPLNQIGVRGGEIVADVALLSLDLEKKCMEFDALAIGQCLRNELQHVAGHVSDESFLILMGTCAALLCHGAQNMVADFVATGAVTKARKGVRR